MHQVFVIDSWQILLLEYYPQSLLEECKYDVKINKMENCINDGLDIISSDDDADNERDNETKSDND